MLNIGLLLKLAVLMVNKVFLEIGTCDFDTCLPLAEQGWSGYMVEADPTHAESMKKQTSRYGVEVRNLAISDYDGLIEFHTSSADEGWVKGIGTVASDNHIGERLLTEDRYSRHIKETISIPCSTLDTFLTESNIDHLDFMKIDTEGHELNILGSYSWRVKPTIVKIEHSHIDDVLMCNMLKSQGYMVWTEKEDIYGVV